LESIKGKFLLSSYRNKSLKEFTERNGWHKQEFKMTLSMTHGYGNPRKKVEVLTANYPIKPPDKE
jgi:DNA adenine methylase